jgi:hypothetical protein
VISRILDYLGRNAIAFTALGCSLLALGGASYAAVSVPNNSVGTAALRNGAVTPPKLNHRSIGGYAAAWAETNNGCQLVASSGGARIAANNPCSSTGGALRISWPGRFPRSRLACVAVGVPSEVSGRTEPAVEADYEGSGRVIVPNAVNPNGGGQGVTVVLVC